ncbi:MAG: hypothetical protein VXA26_11205, partial [Candidatus Neomarinimicrobiota bacterium]
SWAYVVTTGSDAATIYHQRRDNTVWKWDYSYADDSSDASDDSGTNIGDGGVSQVQVNDQSTLSN